MLSERMVGHNHLWFYRDAIEASLIAGDLDGIEHYAGLMEEYTRSEPLPWSDLFIERGRALADHARAPGDAGVQLRLTAVKAEIEQVNMGTALAAVERALAASAA